VDNVHYADESVCVVHAAWLISCRAIAIIGFILQVIGVIMAVILLIWVLCEAMRCCDDEAGWCDRCIIYLTPIFWILAGTHTHSRTHTHIHFTVL